MTVEDEKCLTVWRNSKYKSSLFAIDFIIGFSWNGFDFARILIHYLWNWLKTNFKATSCLNVVAAKCSCSKYKLEILVWQKIYLGMILLNKLESENIILLGYFWSHRNHFSLIFYFKSHWITSTFHNFIS